ncbi:MULTISPECIES: hypothetical protein [Streptomyces]|uniref:Lactococcin 972 family bacteriocin n=1 Tax=Streptomyces canarius TaxID=285453 RepID=A0ABQ3DFM4_9ACTN|nr:hypothetical protein [Streptomyces canarius]GHA68402.1 hypothetical protein GCM10010345_85090 [Streptomyces canarius]
MLLKKSVSAVGLVGALAAGTLTLGASPASAAENHWVRTYYSNSWQSAQSSCNNDAWRANTAIAGTGVSYYCARADSYYSGGQWYYGYNLWVTY